MLKRYNAVTQSGINAGGMPMFWVVLLRNNLIGGVFPCPPGVKFGGETKRAKSKCLLKLERLKIGARIDQLVRYKANEVR